MLGPPPSAERLVYEVRQKCRNMESRGQLGVDSGSHLSGAGGVGVRAWP